MLVKKIYYSIIAIVSVNFLSVSAGESPYEIPEGFPGAGDPETVVEKVSANIISEMIKYVAVLAVLALMISGIMYMLSGGEEDKTKKAKTWIIGSLVGVLLSISSFYLISTISKININL